jgi:hypothetical protein
MTYLNNCEEEAHESDEDSDYIPVQEDSQESEDSIESDSEVQQKPTEGS